MIGIFGVRPRSTAAAVNFPSGTKMLFQQTLAPDGWTKDTTHNDKSLRIVSGAAGSGGATAFSSVFGASKITGSHNLITTEIPSHSHSAGTLATGSSGAHGHGMDLSNLTGGAFNAGEHFTTNVDPGIWASGISGGTDIEVGIVSAGAHTHTVTGGTANAGSGGGHTHTLSLDLNFVDVIIATKD